MEKRIVCTIGIIILIMLFNFISAQEFNIQPEPDLDVISLYLNETKNLSIGSIFDLSKWYLNGDLVEENISIFKIENLESGIYVIRVDVFSGELAGSKTWNIIMKEGVAMKKEDINWGELIFYGIVTVLIIIIFLIIRLFIINNNRKMHPKKKLKKD